VLRKVFDSFDHNKKGSIPSSMVRTSKNHSFSINGYPFFM